ANDAATDLPVAYSFERLDKTFPGSRFIYTVRPLDSWLKSCEAHFDRTHSPSSFAVQLRLDVFGRVDYDSPAFACAYSVHENRVRTYFKNRQMGLLVIDVTAPGQHWGALCSFLGRPRPVAAFPWLNRRTHVEALVRLLHRHLGSITTVAELLEARPQWVATIIAQDDTSGVPSLDDEGMNLAHLMTRI